MPAAMPEGSLRLHARLRVWRTVCACGCTAGRAEGRLSSLLVAHVFASNSWLLGSEKMRAYHADRSARRAARLTADNQSQCAV